MVTSALGKNSNTYVFSRLHRITLFCSSQLIIMEGRKEGWKEGRKEGSKGKWYDSFEFPSSKCGLTQNE